MNQAQRISILKYVLIVFGLILIANSKSFSQNYFITPVSHFDIETNPAILSSEKYKNQIIIDQQNGFNNGNTFNYSSLKLASYIDSKFLGVGLSLNSNSVGNNYAYQTVGLGIGYRNVLFDKAYVRIGAFYKVNFTNSQAGQFYHYNFTEYGLDNPQKLTDNVNLSFALSSSQEKYYLSVFFLNMLMPWGKDKVNYFPQYFVINVGDVGSFFRSGEEFKLSYSYMKSMVKYSLIKYQAHYINTSVNINVSRRRRFRIGSHCGLIDNKYVNIIPYISMNFGHREKYYIKAAVNIFPKPANYIAPYNPIFQLSLKYQI